MFISRFQDFKILILIHVHLPSGSPIDDFNSMHHDSFDFDTDSIETHRRSTAQELMLAADDDDYDEQQGAPSPMT